MQIRNAKASWEGTLKEGNGSMSFTDYEGAYTFASRFENGEGTNPEELVGAAHAGCYSMFLSALITNEGLIPKRVETQAVVSIGKDETGPCITSIKLDCTAICEGLSQEKFEELSVIAKAKCPISRLYSGGTAEIELNATLLS